MQVTDYILLNYWVQHKTITLKNKVALSKIEREKKKDEVFILTYPYSLPILI